MLFKLHWLPIRGRILFKILLITYKAVHGHAPNYIKELIKFKKPGKYNLRSNSDNLLLEIEKVKTYTTLGDRAFQVAAPKLWNNLPYNITIKFPYNARSDWLKQRTLSENKEQVNDLKVALNSNIFVRSLGSNAPFSAGNHAITRGFVR